jgi:hypothetical protein
MPADTPLVVNCPKCRGVMWGGSTVCQRCRDKAELALPTDESGEEKPAFYTGDDWEKRKRT